MPSTDIDTPLVLRMINDMLEHELGAKTLHIKLTTNADYARLFLPDLGMLDALHKMATHLGYFIGNNLHKQQLLKQEIAQEEELAKLQQELRKWKYKLPFWQVKKRQLKAQWDQLMNTDAPSPELYPVPLTIERFMTLAHFFIEVMTAQPPQSKQVSNLAEDIKQFMVAKLFSRELVVGSR